MIPEQEEEHNEGEGVWAITYGDLMSYLMLFFLFMYAFALQSQQSAAGAQQAQETLSEIQKAFGGEESQSVKQRAQEKKADEDIKSKLMGSTTVQGLTVETNADSVKITMKDMIMFPSCSARLNPGAEKVLHEFAGVAKDMANKVIVEGHTDNVPPGSNCSFKSNWELSMARAYSIIKYLVDTEHMDPTKLSGVGYGEFQPLVPNTTKENKAQNRRIQITIARK